MFYLQTFFLTWLASMIVAPIIAKNKGQDTLAYFILAVVLGPLAVLIVACVGDTRRGGQSFTLQDAKKHLFELKSNIKSLQEKSVLLETKINKLSGEEPEIVAESKETLPLEKVVDKKVAQVSQSEGFEQVFGKYWLNRIGVVLFVIGIGLFISYTFQYLNAFAKIGIGYVFSAAFFVWGNHLEKSKKYAKIAWGILGGAWGLLYLSTYAMHYIEATAIISSSAIGLVLLAIVSIAAVYHNLKYKSWIVTAITFILAFITVGLGGMNYSTIVYFSFLVGSIAYLSYRMRWHAFLILGIAGSYLAHLFWSSPNLLLNTIYAPKSAGIEVYQFQIIFSILAISWAIYSLVFLLMKQKNEEEGKLLVTSQLLNAGLFTSMGFTQIAQVKSKLSFVWDERSWLLIILAGMYFLFSFLFKKLKNPKMIVVNVAIAYTLIAMAIFLRVPKISVAFYWILEMAILFVLGIYYKEKIYRVLAGIMSIVVMLRLFFVDLYSDAIYWIVQHNILIFSFAALCFYVFGIIADKNRFGKRLTKSEQGLYSLFFPIFGTVLLVSLFGNEISAQWLSLSWTLLGTSLLALGFFLSNRVLRLNALCVLSLAALRVVFIDMSGINTIYKIFAFTVLGALLLGVSMIYSKYKVKD